MSKHAKFFVFWMLLAAYIIAVSIGHSLYAEKQIDILEENLLELINKQAGVPLPQGDKNERIK